MEQTNGNTDNKKAVKKEKVEKEITLAWVKEMPLSEFIEQTIFLKSLSNDDITKISKLEILPTTIIDIMDNIERNAEYAILKNLFNKTYGYEIMTTKDFDIPIIIKELFITDHSTNKTSKITNSDIVNILSSNFIPFDIHGKTLSVLMRTPEFKKDLITKIMPFLSWKGLKKINIVLTSKELFEYYKEILTYNDISDEI